MYLLKVLVERKIFNLDNTFFYFSNNEVKVGVRVKVNFHESILFGFVLEVNEITKPIKEIEEEYGFEIKEVNEIIEDEPILNEELMKLGVVLAKKYFAPLISVYQTFLPSTLRPKNLKNISKISYSYFYIVHKDKINFKINRFQEKILAKFNYFSKIPKKEIANTKALNDLISKGVIALVKEEKYRYEIKKIFDYEHAINLSSEQNNIFNEILNSNFLTYLLYGITGSGKTEIYIKLIEDALLKNKTSLILVPEIALTPLMISRIISYFDKDLVSVLHSSLTENQKYDEYRKISSGKSKIVIGTRSAIFAPLTDIGYIIIDEENSDTYKEESLLPYQARDVAQIRAKYYGGKVILGSATPSIESMAKAKNGIYKLLELKTRFNKSELPLIKVVDRKDFNNYSAKSSIFSLFLINTIKDRLSKNEQVILFINNRGYGRSFYCRECGYVFRCPKCGSTLVYHKEDNTLRCHHCEYKESKPTNCPRCNSKYLSYLSYGIEKVEEDFKKIFNVPYAVLDGDRTSKTLQISSILSKFAKKEVNVLIGTQIISKGHDFKDVTLVGVINADSLLTYPSFIAHENTFCLLTQTIGRAGRSDKKGEAIIQTSFLNDYAIKNALNNDYEKFYEEEIKERKKLNNPPFTNILSIGLSSKKSDLLKDCIYDIYNSLLISNLKAIIFSPTNESFFKNTFTRKIFIKYKTITDIENKILDIIDTYKSKSEVQIRINISPLDF
ncbi:MAG: primosomal protein N' [Firmicutes bacterium]|uniref:Replication restart protein PriA n=1 Tax=Candidatus Onthovivens merdipullorum TaxID=2840889 RepID=A0A9D9DHC0_9BACL|nr:primosomal protein N' [Candidatus Onthovivens merdipullorum]